MLAKTTQSIYGIYNHRSFNIEKSSVMQLHGTLHVDHIHIPEYTTCTVFNQ